MGSPSHSVPPSAGVALDSMLRSGSHLARFSLGVSPDSGANPADWYSSCIPPSPPFSRLTDGWEEAGKVLVPGAVFVLDLGLSYRAIFGLTEGWWWKQMIRTLRRHPGGWWGRVHIHRRGFVLNSWFRYPNTFWAPTNRSPKGALKPLPSSRVNLWVPTPPVYPVKELKVAEPQSQESVRGERGLARTPPSFATHTQLLAPTPPLSPAI